MQFDTMHRGKKHQVKELRDKIILIFRQYDCLQRKFKRIIRQTTKTIWVLQLKQQKISEAFINE